jgi:hypothetical protein
VSIGDLCRETSYLRRRIQVNMNGGEFGPKVAVRLIGPYSSMLAANAACLVELLISRWKA